MDLDNLVYLLKYDTLCGRSENEVEAAGGNLVVAGKPDK
jgi:hypothetical protein